MARNQRAGGHARSSEAVGMSTGMPGVAVEQGRWREARHPCSSRLRSVADWAPAQPMPMPLSEGSAEVLRGAPGVVREVRSPGTTGRYGRLLCAFSRSVYPSTPQNRRSQNWVDGTSEGSVAPFPAAFGRRA